VHLEFVMRCIQQALLDLPAESAGTRWVAHGLSPLGSASFKFRKSAICSIGRKRGRETFLDEIDGSVSGQPGTTCPTSSRKQADDRHQLWPRRWTHPAPLSRPELIFG
jgi:hypothetical protein